VVAYSYTHLLPQDTYEYKYISVTTQADGWVGQRKGEKEIKSIKYM
jgi:hypothetical protein